MQKEIREPNLDWFAAENRKLLGALHEEPRESVCEHLFQLVGLLDLDRHAHCVDGRLDKGALGLVTRDDERVENELLVHAVTENDGTM